MQHEQMVFLFAATVLLGLGVANLFFTERFFYWTERRKYAYPLEPSLYKLRSMRVNGCIDMLLGFFVAYIGIAGH